MTSPSTNRKPVLLGLAASALLTVLIVVSSRNLEHHDSARLIIAAPLSAYAPRVNTKLPEQKWT